MGPLGGIQKRKLRKTLFRANTLFAEHMFGITTINKYTDTKGTGMPSGLQLYTSLYLDSHGEGLSLVGTVFPSPARKFQLLHYT